MNSDRHTFHLDEVFDFRSGLSKPRSAFGTGFPFLTFKDVFYNYFVPKTLGDLVETSQVERSNGDIKRGDVFLTRTSETQHELGMSCVALADVPNGTFNGFTKRLRPKPGINIIPEYAGYYFRSPDFRQTISAISTLSTRASLNEAMLARLKINLPSADVQLSIGTILKSLDDKINLLREMNRTLEEIARTLFRAWFVDFEPVRAKAAGSTSFQGVSQALFDTLPDALETSPDGEIPAGWHMGSLSSLISLNPESWPRAKYPDQIDYVDLSNTKWGTIEKITPFVREEAPSRAQRILRPGDTILGTVRPGNGSYAFVSAQGLTGSTGFAVLRPNQHIFREAVYLAATAKENISRLAQLADGGAYPAIRPELVAATQIVIAPESIFAAFSSIAGTLLGRAETAKREIQTLTTLRDTLLPKLISGELQAPDLATLGLTEASDAG